MLILELDAEEGRGVPPEDEPPEDDVIEQDEFVSNPCRADSARVARSPTILVITECQNSAVLTQLLDTHIATVDLHFLEQVKQLRNKVSRASPFASIHPQQAHWLSKLERPEEKQCSPLCHRAREQCQGALKKQYKHTPERYQKKRMVSTESSVTRYNPRESKMVGPSCRRTKKESTSLPQQNLNIGQRCST